MNKSEGEGILLVDKEKKLTAFYLVKLLRKISNIKKIGHAGTLDPFATGVMVMLIGQPYTKLASSLINNDKEYISTLKMGEATDSFDCDGQVTHKSNIVPTLKDVESVISKFQGTIEQIPPMFSAKKINGKKLYTFARKGIDVERKPVKVNVSIKILDYCYPNLKLHVHSSKGTYIRSLAHDIGVDLGCYAYLVALQRIRSGSFLLKDCISAKLLFNKAFAYAPFLRKSL